ncbi:MAG: thermonuclease family protein [Candidatus Thiodiazotropha sp.]
MPLLVLLGLLVCVPDQELWAMGFSGRVTAVLSGNEIQVTAPGGQPQQIRLAGISPIPAERRPLDSARRHLGTLLLGRHVEVIVKATHHGGVILGRVLHGGSDPAEAMLKAGLAQVAPTTALEPERMEAYRAAQRQARSRNMGFWHSGR